MNFTEVILQKSDCKSVFKYHTAEVERIQIYRKEHKREVAETTVVRLIPIIDGARLLRSASKPRSTTNKRNG